MSKNLINQILAIILIAIILIGIFPPIKVQATDETDDGMLEFALLGIKVIAPNHLVLTKDVVISENWEPIKNFTGIFDGNGHSITFNINETTGPIPNTQYLGLFDSCTNATIKNLYVNGNISLNTGGSVLNPNIFVGGIVGSSTNSTLENVHFSGNINVITNNDNSSWVGGLVGKATNTQILLSSNTAPITSEVDSVIGSTKVGGLCGEFSGTIENCYNMGNVVATATTESPYAGGIVGNNKGSITKSYNSGKVQSEGSGMSFSDVYAGGITAIGETGSSVTDCAVMSPEISVTIGWINSGYKYIIANGGSKSNNISINSITGSPTNDSNIRYTQAEMKTTTPYMNFDFYNTWAIDETINNGYPYHDRNIYAINNIEYQNVPNGLKYFIDNNYININDLKQTSDGFTLCTKSLKDILSSMGISKIRGVDGEYDVNDDLDCWYIYNIGTSYSILKMRGLNDRSIGTSIPFMDFDIGLISLFHNDLVQEVEQSENEVKLYNALDRLIYGIVDSQYYYCLPIASYFATVTSKANHLIAEEYIRKVLSNERDAQGYIQVPSYVEDLQRNFLMTLPNIYDSENNRIKVNKYNLTNLEKRAILASRVGDLSLNIYAAENIAHAQFTICLGDSLQGNVISVQVPIENSETHEMEFLSVSQAIAKDWFLSAIKSDAGIGEESLPKELIAYTFKASELLATFGDV